LGERKGENMRRGEEETWEWNQPVKTKSKDKGKSQYEEKKGISKGILLSCQRLRSSSKIRKKR